MKSHIVSRASMMRTAAAFCVAAGLSTWVSADDGPSRFAIPRLSAPPLIDGAIEPSEWRGALRLDGVTGVGGGGPVDARETTFWVGWDAGHIYIAARSQLREGERLATVHRIVDTQFVVFDDSHEIGFDTLGRSQRPGDDPFNFKLMINYFDRLGPWKSIPSIGGFQYTWNPQFERASRITDDRKFWEFEMAMPMRELEQERDNQVGDQLRLLLGRNYKYPWNQTAVPLMKSGYFESSGWPVATLVEATPYVHLLDVFRIPHVGRAVARVRVVNPGVVEQTVTVTTSWSGDLKTAETLTIPAGGEAVHVVDDELAEPRGHVTIQAVTADGVTLLATRIGYNRDAKIPPYERGVVKEGDLPLNVDFNPLRGQAWMQGDTLDMPWLEAGGRMEWELKNEAGARIAQGEIAEKRYAMFADLLEFGELAPGAYILSARLFDDPGRVLGEGQQELLKKNEREAFPWLGNDLGQTERVIPPFAALGRDGDRISAWGRTYTLSGLGLPLSMVSQGGELLAEPVRIVVVQNGRETVVPMDGTPEIVETTDWRIRFRGRGEGAGLRFTVEGALEQDGNVFYDLQYEPLAGESVAIKALRLEYPLRDAEPMMIHCVGAGGNYAAKTTDFLPDGEGKVWDTLVLGRQASVMTVGSFFPQLWLGNDQRGFLWWADSDQGWFPENEIPAHEVLRQNGRVILRNNLIASPVALAHSRRVRFSLNATPFKPLRPGWRIRTDNGLGRFSGEGFKEEGRIKGWNLLHAPSRDPGQWLVIYARYAAEAERRMVQRIAWNRELYTQGILASGVPLTGYGHRTLEKEVLDYFDADWQDSLSPSQRDYYLHLVDQWIREGGLKRLYLDITFPKQYSSLLSGTAYRLPDGRIQPGFTIENMRRLYMRWFALFHDHGHMPNGLTGHSTNNYPLPILAWLEILLDGEFNHVKDDSPFEWIDGMPAHRIRAMNLPANWGLPFAMLVKLQMNTRAEEQARQGDSVRGWLRLHDNWENTQPYDYWAWGLGRADVQHTPYWRVEGLVQVNKPNLRVALWQHAEGVLALVFNDHKTEAADDVRVSLDLSKLGLDGLAANEKLVFDVIQGKTDGTPVFDKQGGIGGFGLQARKWTTVAISRVAIRAELPVQDAHTLTGLVPDRLWRWGLARDDARPGEALVKLADEALTMQAWQRPNRLLLLIRNPTAETRAVRATVDMQAAGLLPINPIRNRIGWQILGHARVVGDRRAGLLGFDPVEGVATTRLEAGGWMAVEIERH